MDDAIPCDVAPEAADKDVTFTPMNRTVALVSAVAAIALVAAGCWDMREVNQLAIVDMAALDFEPQTGMEIGYYQVVNPNAITQQQASGLRSPVYTYRVEGRTIADLGRQAALRLPRELFPDHYQSIIVSERRARKEIMQLLDFFERQFDRRSTVQLFVAVDPLEDVMTELTPLERRPGNALRKLVEIQSSANGALSRRNRIKDVLEDLATGRCAVVPIVRLKGKPVRNVGRYQSSDADAGNLYLHGGAVFCGDRMVGELGHDDMSWYHALSGRTAALGATVRASVGSVDVRTERLRIQSRLDAHADPPVWRVRMKAALHVTGLRPDKPDLTHDDLRDICLAFERKASERASAVYDLSVRRGWDLFGLRRKMTLAGRDAAQWSTVRLRVDIGCRVLNPGELAGSYGPQIESEASSP